MRRRKPETDNIYRFIVKKRAVLVAGYLTTDPWLLEDVHRLQQQRRRDPEIRHEVLDF